MNYGERFRNIILEEDWLVDCLCQVNKLRLPDWYIAGGALRNTIWNALHGFPGKSNINDIDVAYFNPNYLGIEEEKSIERSLHKINPNVNWEVINQSQGHFLNQPRKKVKSSCESIAYWSETPTCIGIRMEDTNSLSICAPHGLGDLMNLVVRPIPKPYQNLDLYRSRIEEKQWGRTWPKLKIEEV